MTEPSWMDRRKEEIEQLSWKLAPIASDGRDVYFRPWELLLSPAAEQDPSVRQRLEEYDGQPYYPDDGKFSNYWRNLDLGHPGSRKNINEGLGGNGIAFKLYVLMRQAFHPEDTVAFVSKLRELRKNSLREQPRKDPDEDPSYGVHLNHVLFAEQIYQGGPEGPPEKADPPPLPGTGAHVSPLTGTHVTVLDTGIPDRWDEWHSELSRPMIQPDSDDLDRLDELRDRVRDTCGGHGLFICGLIHRMAPALCVDPGKVLSAMGDGDAAGMAAEPMQLRSDVINMSFGCYTDTGGPPAALADWIRTQINVNGRAVVAAAGNGGATKQFWPAAMEEVIAVGSWDRVASAPAPTSNRGDWVNVWAPGRNLLGYYLRHADWGFEGWAKWSGTSFAAPQVATKVALLKQVAPPGMTARDVALNLIGSLREARDSSGVVYGKLFDEFELHRW